MKSPAVSSIQGAGIIPTEHPLFLWSILGRSSPSFAFEVQKEADLILAIGVRFGEVATGSYGYVFSKKAKIIHVDIDKEALGKNIEATLKIHADARAFLEKLLKERSFFRKETFWISPSYIKKGKERFWKSYRKKKTKGVNPGYFIQEVQKFFPDAIYVTDSGNTTFLAIEHLKLTYPDQLIGPVDYSCMGYSVPASLGAKLVNPSKDVIGFIGDGAFLMTGLEVLTGKMYQLSPILFLFHDRELGLIGQFQKRPYNRKPATSLITPDFSLLAKSLGIPYLYI